MTAVRGFGVLGVVTALVMVLPGVGTSVARARAKPLTPVPRCEITDERLGELSGLVASRDAWFAVNDGGSSVRVFVLDPRDCSVRDVITSEVDPYDVEGLEMDDRGRLWLADIGDNSLRRDTVAVHVVGRDGGTELYRFRYPDGPHNAEAMLLGPDGVPHIVTKDPFGAAGVYRPAGRPGDEEVTPLERVGTVSVSPTGTPGGPLPGSLGSVVFTGGAVSHDGTVIALRTYTDAYLYPLSDGGIPAALRKSPLRVPLPNEPQGEALAFTPGGTLLSASEGREPVRAVTGAVAALRDHARGPAAAPSTHQRPTASESEPRPVPASGKPGADQGSSTSGALLTAGALAAVLLVAVSRLRRRNRR